MLAASFRARFEKWLPSPFRLPPPPGPFLLFVCTLEQELKYFPANSIAALKVIWSPHFETRTERFPISGRKAGFPWIILEWVTAVFPSPFPWKVQGGVDKRWKVPSYFLPSCFSDPCPLSPQVFMSGGSKSHSVSGISCLCSKVKQKTQVLLSFSFYFLFSARVKFSI